MMLSPSLNDNLTNRWFNSNGPLHLYLMYRVVLAAGLTIVFFNVENGLLGWFKPELFRITVLTYLFLNLVSLIFLKIRPDTPRAHGASAVFVDIVITTILMHATGGIESGLGVMYAITIALGSMSISGLSAYMFALMGASALIAERVYVHFVLGSPSTLYTHTALLSASLIALAALAHQLSLRLKRSERLAEQRADELANMAEINELIIQKMRTGILLVDEEGKIQLWNRSARKLLQIPSSVEAFTIQDANPALALWFAQWQRETKRKKTFAPKEEQEEFRATFTRLGDVEGDTQNTLIFIDDASHLKARAQEMKLASLGKLTSGIAHEIRNPLGAISHAAQLLNEAAEELPQSERRMGEIIHNNCQRVNQTIENVLNLARKSPSNKVEIALADWVAEQCEEIRSNHQLNIEQMEIRSVVGNCHVMFDPAQIRQVLDVLCENSVVHFNEDAANLRITLRLLENESGLWLYCCDNGSGIDPEHIQHIFEPFFTTRNAGTGLGLYIAHQLCEINHIHLSYEKNADAGGCFKLHLPDALEE